MQLLDRVAGLLDSDGGARGSLTLLERGDSAPVPRHPGFRLMAAMNPATDAGGRVNLHHPRDTCMSRFT